MSGYRIRCLLAAAALVATAASPKPRDDDTASFAVAYHGETTAYRDAALALMPGASVTIDAVGGPPGDYAAASLSGVLVQRALKRWTWTAPTRPGSYLISVAGPAKNDRIDVHAFVMVPASRVKGGMLNGYRIGEYPPARGSTLYTPPPGFIEVTADNQHTRVSPHFALAQFLCK